MMKQLMDFGIFAAKVVVVVAIAKQIGVQGAADGVVAAVVPAKKATV